jgi:MFS transporter, putative metabolite:H+ symporter
MEMGRTIYRKERGFTGLIPGAPIMGTSTRIQTMGFSTKTMSPTQILRPGTSFRGLGAAKLSAMSRTDLLVVAVCALGFIFDLSEIAFGSALSGVFSIAPYRVPPGQLSWLLASVYVGAILGPPFMGAFADRRGPRTALAVALLFLAALSVGSAFSPSIGALSVLRGLSGIALGAYPPLMITYLTDVLPARLRGRLIMVTVAAAYFGPPATIFLMRWLTPLSPLGLEGWRWVIGIDGVGALTAGLLFICLPESMKWRQAAEHPVSSSKTSIREIALVTMLSFLAPWATVAFPLLTAAFLVAKGFNFSDTLLYVGVSTFGPIVSSGMAATVADRFQRRTSVVACSLGMAAAAAGFYVSDSAGWLMLTSFAFNLCLALYMPALNTYVAELFPTRVRGRATSWAWSANRVAAAAVPLVMLPWLRRDGEARVFTVIVATLLATVLLISAFGQPGKAGQPVV